MPGRWRHLGRRATDRARGPLTRRRRVRLAVAAVACLVAAGLVARDWSATLGATDRAAARLDQTRAELDRTGDDLATTRARVGSRRETLGGELGTLGTRQAERADARGTLDATGLWLAALESQLAAATAELEASTGRLGSLQACLVGASRALNQAAARDTAGMAATVRAVEGVCAEAGVDL